ncbi:MAG: response regulator [Parerythrobacter sp.]
MPLGSVLIVEDDPVIAMATQMVFEDAGAVPITVTASTQDAMAALRSKLPDVLVLDIHLSDSDDGWAIAELIQSLDARNTRIIFATGAPQDIPAPIAALGTVLEKPLAANALLAAARRAPRRGVLAALRRSAR